MSAPNLPLPVARLRRRSHNAKSPKDRHDSAYFAFEVSVRLAVAARPPADAAGLARASLGAWAAAVDAPERPLDAPALLDLHALLTEVGLGDRASARSITGRKLLAGLAAYRNRVVGHGSPRAASFYEGAGETLLAGLDAAWDAEVFWPRAARLAFVESIAIEAQGGRRARVLDLTTESPLVLDPLGTPVGEEVRPRRLYVRAGGAAWRGLHPWVVYVERDERERVYCFNGMARSGAVYLDYASGETVRAGELEGEVEGLEGEVARVFAGGGSGGGGGRGELQKNAEDAEEQRGREANRFGEYEVLGKLGAGGMGVVYLARQESLERMVALKMLPGEAAKDPVATGRFAREVAALSRCEHPHVVKILASGVARDTRYYAMEYVEGADLAAVARALSTTGDFDAAVSTASDRVRAERKELFSNLPEVPRATPEPLPPRGGDRFARVAALFRDAARGVQHLHEHGIIHRDLKPANIMVTDRGHRAVVMDLGLAALSDASLSLTRDKGQILGTLRYIPPEQLQRNLVDVDRRADVYSLGAALYELVTDRPFFDGDSEARLIQQVLREDPVPPERANPAVPRDLAAIVRKATEKDPARRYDTAEALARDLDAFVAGRPIAARAPTLGYVLGLAIRRHKAVFAAAAIATLLAAADAAFVITRLAQAKARETAAREAAERNLARAEDLVEFMVGDLRTALEPMGKLDLLEKIARKASAYYDESGPAETVPGSQRRRAAVLEATGGVLRARGDIAAALEAYARAIEIREAVAAAEPQGATRGALELAAAEDELGQALCEQGDLGKALDAYRRALAARQRLATRPGVDVRRDLARSGAKIGEVLVAQGAAGALDALKDALAIREGLVREMPADPERRRDLAASHATIAAAANLQGDLDGALASARAAIVLREALAAEAPGDADRARDLAAAHDSLGDLTWSTGDIAAAERSYDVVRAIRARLAAQDPGNAAWQQDLAQSYVNSSAIANVKGDAALALEEQTRALEIRRRLARSDPGNASWQASYARTLSTCATRLTTRGDGAAAAEADAEALRLTEALVARDPTNTEWQRYLVDAIDPVAARAMADGDLAGALAGYRRGLDLAERLSARDPTHLAWRRELADEHASLARALNAAGDLDGALEHAEAALAAYERVAALAPRSLATLRALASALTRVGDFLGERGDLSGSLERYRRAIAIRERIAAEHPDLMASQAALASGYEGLGDALRSAGDLPAALDLYERGQAILARLTARDPANASLQQDLASADASVGAARESRGDLAGALESYRAALAIREDVAARLPDDERQSDLGSACSDLGDALDSLGDADGAAATYGRALAIAERLAARDPTNTNRMRELESVVEHLASVQAWRGDLGGARASYRRSLGIAEVLAARDPTSALHASDLSTSCRRMARALSDQGDSRGAVELGRRGLEIAETLAARDPKNADQQRLLAQSLLDLATLLRPVGEPAVICQLTARAVALLAALLARDPASADAATSYADALLSEAELREGACDLGAAVTETAAAVALHEAVAARDPVNRDQQANVAFARECLGRALCMARRFDEAIAAYRAALELRERHAAAEPRSISRKRTVANCRSNLALIELHRGDTAAALAALGPAEVIRAEVAESNPKFVVDSWWGDMRRREIEARLSRPAILSGAAAPTSTADHLVVAYDRFRARDCAVAVEHFALALRDEAIRSGMRESHLYNAVCSAALAAESAPSGEAAEGFRRRSIAWLREDLELRRADVVALDGELAAGVTPARAAVIWATRRLDVRHFQLLRLEDPDLCAIRGSPGFEAALAAFPDPGAPPEPGSAATPAPGK